MENQADLQKEIDAQIEFISVIAHQIKTPLTGIKWSFKMLINGELGPITAEQKQVLEDGYKNNERIISLIDEMRQASKARLWNFVYNKQRLDLETHLRSVIDEFIPTSKSKHIPITFTVQGEKKDVFADPTKISIVLENLLENAFKYTPEDESNHEVTLDLIYTPNYAEVKIHNDGTTVVASDKETVFDKYARGTLAKSSHIVGTGLGLFTTKRIIDGHGGTINFSSDSAESGTTLSFTLPFTEDTK